MNIIKLNTKPTSNGSLIIPKNFTGMADFTDGTKMFFRNGKLHREDGPAVVYPKKGPLGYFLNGEGKNYTEWLILRTKLGQALFG